MQWKNYIIVGLIISTGIITIFFLDNNMSKKNQEMLKLSTISAEIYAEKTKTFEMLDLRNYLIQKENFDEERIKISPHLIESLNIIINQKNSQLINAPTLLENLKGHISYIESTQNIPEKEIKVTLNKFVNKYESSKSILRNKIMRLRDIRNYIFILSVIFLVLFLITELFKISFFNRKIATYLNKLPHKNYDFQIIESDIPYINSILNEIKNLKEKLKTIDDTIKASLKGYSIESSLTELFKNKDFQKYINFGRIGFATIEGNQIIANLSVSNNNNILLGKGFSIDINESKSLQQIIKSKEPRIISDLEEHMQKNPNSLSTKLILDEGYVSSLTVPLIKSSGVVSGFIFFSSSSKNAFSDEDKYKISSIADILSGVFQKNMLIEDLVTNAALTFVKLVEGKDPETSNHLNRMSRYSKIIAKELAKTDKYEKILNYIYIEELYKFSPLHDIGKVGIPDKILLKPGKLTDDEFEVMKQHASMGAKVLSFFKNNLNRYNIDFMGSAIEIAVSHHEKWDGSGYPNGLKGTDIPLSGRIVSVADVFDALTSKRIYKEAYSFEKSLNIVKDMSGSSFDPDVVNAFLDSLDKIKEVYEELKEV